MLALLLPKDDLDAILDNPKLAGSLISCTVADDGGRVLFERNSGMRVVPASNQKLLSNSYALYKLGAGFQPQTRIWKLADRVVVDSPGDPMMTHERLQRAAVALKLDNAKPVYVREAYRPLVGPSWEWDDLPNRYAAPVCAFTIDRGAVELWAEGESLTVLPYRYWLRPVRGVKSGKRKVVYDPIRRTLTVNGELPKVRTRIDTLALDQPDAAAASFLGGAFRSTEDVPSTPPDLTMGGPPLKQMIKECLVHSDNNIAENLLLMAASAEKPLGNEPYAVADERLGHFLATVVGVLPGDFHPEDGSGMSRHDLVTTRGIVKLLGWAARQPSRDIWLDALAKPGTGTLRDRLKEVSFVGKTGSLDMVAALSGYVHTSKNRTLTVSLILNHFLCSEKEARGLADDFIKKLVEEHGFGTLSASKASYEARPSHPCPDPADAYWDRRSCVDGVDARTRPDYRAQSDHAILHRAERVALRPR